jgi:MFS family permease
VLTTQTIARNFDRIGPRRLVVVGQVGLATTLLVLASFNGGTPIWAFCLVLFLAGVANGLSMVSLQAAMFADIRSDSLSRAATVLNVNRQFSTALGVGIATAIVTSGASEDPTSPGTYQIAFLVTAGFSICAAAIGTGLPRRIVPGVETPPASGLNLAGSGEPIPVPG